MYEAWTWLKWISSSLSIQTCTKGQRDSCNDIMRTQSREGLNLWCSQTFQKQSCVPYPIYSGGTFPCALFCDHASHFLRANYIDSVSGTLLEVKGSRLSLVACAILNVLVGFARGLLAGCPGNGS